ncbi:response regulator [Phytopseudomonas dryadis]|uniref:Response regulatory domain-containing protein n=1 Tax=Phytopseudomonas dryadis TaxID=2487520 RepID=A0ABY1Z6B1_9GAMM|nr:MULTISPECIES: response regulator [Pseudomonas]TBV02245.1 hypothetical protein DNK34_19240 [Pseudomonas dryadis]TBV15188.1 hypothetical protein DNK41_18125 [Pseudomonas sp. FRB 230]
MSHPTPTVLIVEDDPLLLMLLAEYLQGEGYVVLQADCATAAFAILAARPHLDLLITDFRLPGGVSGVRIAEPALLLRLDLKVIFISGHPAEVRETGSALLDSAPLLSKPFTLDTLRAQIDHLLD